MVAVWIGELFIYVLFLVLAVVISSSSIARPFQRSGYVLVYCGERDGHVRRYFIHRTFAHARHSPTLQPVALTFDLVQLLYCSLNPAQTREA